MLILDRLWRFVPSIPLTAAVAFGLLATVASANAGSEDNETIISARSMHSDQAAGIVTAAGKVEIARNGYILHADKVTYDQKSNVMHAEGHVAMLAPSGEVQFADNEDVSGDMKQAFIQNVSILFPDNSRMVAKSMQRYDERYMTADTAAYTSCNVCKDDPKTPPLWQLRAEKVVHDNSTHDIYYHNTTIDFAGVPVFYTPYMSTPDPTVERRQGFLSPMPGYSPTLGGYIRAPYYFDIAPNQDAMIAPTFSEKQILQLGGNYRRRFAQGNMTLDGSFTHADLINDAHIDEGKQWRGHFFGKFLYDINNIWRAGSDVNFASDKTYLPTYRYGSSNQLTSRNYLEGFSGRNYASINQYYFEDLRPGTTAVQPIVLPRANFSAFGQPGQTWGGRWSFDGNTLLTTRDNKGQSIGQQGPDTRRIALNGGWERQLISDQTGFATRLSGLMHVDAYSADNVVDPTGNNKIYNQVLLARQFEQANARISYPLSRSGDGYQQLLEPMVAVTLAPNFHNSAKQPIEDSQDINFDETNLFSSNRFTGYDLIEGGSRATYGLRHMLTTDSGGRVDIFGGQSYDFSRNSSFAPTSGLHDHVSDYVGRVGFIPNKYVDMNYSFRLDHKTFEPQREYAQASVGVPLFRPYARYSSGYSLGTAGTIEKIDDATFGFDSHFLKYWTFHLDHVQGFDPGPGPRSTEATLGYGDECFVAAVTVSQNDTTQAGLSSGTSVLFHFFLRNLGGIHTDSALSGNFPAEFRQTD